MMRLAKQDKQTNITPPDDNAEWERMVKNAEALPELHPKLRFGEQKNAEVAFDVEFLDDAPRFETFKDKYNGGAEGRVMFINVRVLRGPDTLGSIRALPMPAKESHGLTRGVLNVAKKHGNKLKGVAARIETRNYNHQTYGPTRGFNVTEITPPDDISP